MFPSWRKPRFPGSRREACTRPSSRIKSRSEDQIEARNGTLPPQKARGHTAKCWKSSLETGGVIMLVRQAQRAAIEQRPTGFIFSDHGLPPVRFTGHWPLATIRSPLAPLHSLPALASFSIRRPGLR